MSAVHYSNEELNHFWLNILADNTLIIRNALSPDEEEDTKRAKAYTDKLDALAVKAGNAATPENNRLAFEAAQEVRRFFIYMLNKKVSEVYHLDLKPATINLFAGETEKYMDDLSQFMKGKTPQYDPITEEIFWLPIFTLQARYISDNIGYYEKEYREIFLSLADTLNNSWSYSIELKGIITRIGETYTRLADQHHVWVANKLRELNETISTIITLQMDTRIAGSLSILYMDSSRKSICFYLMQWARSINEKDPDCNPYAKRISIY